MVDTTGPSLPAPPVAPSGSESAVDGGGPPVADGPTGRSGPGWKAWSAIAAVVVLVVGGIAVNLIEVDYVAIAPGGARPVGELVTVEGGESFTADGEVLFTTVTLDDDVTVWEAFTGWLESTTDLEPKDEILGDRSESESRELNDALMSDSKETAVQVAFDHLGLDVISGTGAIVSSVDPELPAADVFESGDVIVEVEGAQIELGEDVVAAIRAREPGDEVQVVVEGADGDQRDETLTLEQRPDDPEAGYVGIGVATRDLAYDLPFEVMIDSGEVGGPSAGLAFTLAVLDALTPGELTGGVDVAVSGTIDGLGVVGRVGGVKQKAAAVDAVGADVFIVPAAEVDEARAGAGDVPVRGVETLQEALEALAEFGGNALELEALDLAA